MLSNLPPGCSNADIENQCGGFECRKCFEPTSESDANEFADMCEGCFEKVRKDWLCGYEPIEADANFLICLEVQPVICQ